VPTLRRDRVPLMISTSSSPITRVSSSLSLASSTTMAVISLVIDAIGKTALGLGIWVHPEQRGAMIEQLRATGSLRNFEHRVRTKSGQARDVWVSAEIIQIGDALCNLALVQDITERKRADEALRAAYQTLEQRVTERTKELATLNSIAAVVSRSLDLKDILSDALERTMQSTEIERGSAHQLDEATQTLILMAQRGSVG